MVRCSFEENCTVHCAPTQKLILDSVCEYLCGLHIETLFVFFGDEMNFPNLNLATKQMDVNDEESIALSWIFGIEHSGTGFCDRIVRSSVQKTCGKLV